MRGKYLLAGEILPALPAREGFPGARFHRLIDLRGQLSAVGSSCRRFAAALLAVLGEVSVAILDIGVLGQIIAGHDVMAAAGTLLDLQGLGDHATSLPR